MSYGWENAEKTTDDILEGLFIKLPEKGDKVVGVLVGEPFFEVVYWDKTKFVLFDEQKHDVNKRNLNCKMNIFIPRLGAMKIINIDAKLMRAILKAKKKHDLGEIVVELERTGVSKNTAYTCTKEDVLTKALKDKIESVTPHNLEKYSVSAQSKRDDEIPF